MDRRMKYRVIFSAFILLILIALLWSISKFSDYQQVFHSDDKDADKIFKVVIDPGHGGKDVGAIGISGFYEKDFALSLSKKINEILENEEKILVYMTREEDTFISTVDKYRPEYANELDADLLISIHGNTFEDPEVAGTESYYYHKEFKTFADIIHEKVVASTGFKNRGVKKKDLFVVRDAQMPSVLLEIGFLTNPEEEQRMYEEEFQTSVAEAICEGIKEYLEIE